MQETPATPPLTGGSNFTHRNLKTSVNRHEVSLLFILAADFNHKVRGNMNEEHMSRSVYLQLVNHTRPTGLDFTFVCSVFPDELSIYFVVKLK